MARANPVRYLLGALLAVAAFAGPAASGLPIDVAAAQTTARGPSGLPLPRFVSLKASKVNLRIGPGLNYSVDWMYLKEGLPMEIIQEYDNWRRVRDAEGAEGWINQALLSGRRTAIAAPWQRGKEARVVLHAEADIDSATVALVEPGAVGTIRECNGNWCEMDFAGHEGWVRQSLLWGAYPDEAIAE